MAFFGIWTTLSVFTQLKKHGEYIGLLVIRQSSSFDLQTASENTVVYLLKMIGMDIHTINEKSDLEIKIRDKKIESLKEQINNYILNIRKLIKLIIIIMKTDIIAIRKIKAIVKNIMKRIKKNILKIL